jgi:serine/threonine protein kinase
MNNAKIFLAEKCGDDADLKREVLSLLEAQKATDGFMENSAMNLMAKEIAHNQTTVVDFSIIGRELGSYRIERPLGAGGMGEVYLAYDSKLKRRVALKTLPAEFVLDDERIKRFEREARAVSALNHPNIVTIYDFGQADGINYIVTELIEGKTVRELINTKPPLKETLSIVSQTCDALSAAHKLGIVHRDIKPENIMVRPDGYVKVLDFGLAKLNPQAGTFQISLTNYTQKGMIIGTLAYMSPEQVSDDNVDHRTDLWSLGVVLYEMLTGVNPFKGENRQATLNAILTLDPPRVSELNPSLPAELDAILSKALEKDADVSYQTASDIRADLKRVRREIDSSPSSGISASQKTREAKAGERQRNYFPPAFGFLTLALLGFGIWFFFFSQKPAAGDVDWSKAQNSPATDSLAVESYPSFSPDGKTLVFSLNAGGSQDIFQQRVGGKNLNNLTEDSKEDDTMPAYSPDGRFIAFRSERSPKGIYVMEATGENVRRVSDFGFHPSWSPDGAKIVVSEQSSIHHTLHTVPNSSLWILDVKSGEKRQLDTKGDAIMPSWSPNGQRIAYWFVQSGKSGEIATVSADGNEEPVIVTNDAFSDWNPIWSPDGNSLYFASDRGGNMNLWRIAIDEKSGTASNSPESVSTPSKYCRHLAVSRNGKMLGYVRYESRSNLQTIGFDLATKKTVGDVKWVTRANHEVTNPVLSPNGEQFVVRHPKQNREDLIIFDKDGANWRSLTDDAFLERIPRWSRDGGKIAFHSDRGGKYQVWTINPDGSDLRQITFSEKTGAYIAAFSPDDSRLVFTEIDGKSQKPFILDLNKTWQEQTPQPLRLNDDVSAWAIDWSPDGKKLLMLLLNKTGGADGIAIYDLTNSTYQKITNSGSFPYWLSDNRHFIYNDDNVIFIFDTQTGQTSEIFKPQGYEIQNVNISADNKMIYFRYLQIDADIWLIDASNSQ